MHNNLIILAGGASSRMKQPASATQLSTEEELQANQRTKGLIGIGSEKRPLLDFLLNNAKKAGYKNIYFIVSKNNILFREFYGEKDRDNDFNGLLISYAVQHIPEGRDKPYGTADALWQCLKQYPELIEESFSVCNSDNIYSVRALEAMRMLYDLNGFVSYDRDSLEFSMQKISRFALARLNEKNYLVDIIEKPDYTAVEKYRGKDGKLRVSMNLFKFTGNYIFPFVRDCPVNIQRNEKELQTAILNMLEKYPGTMKGVDIAEHVPDLTTKDDITIIKEYILKHYDSLQW